MCRVKNFSSAPHGNIVNSKTYICKTFFSSSLGVNKKGCTRTIIAEYRNKVKLNETFAVTLEAGICNSLHKLLFPSHTHTSNKLASVNSVVKVKRGQTWVKIQSELLSSCVKLGKSFYLYKPISSSVTWVHSAYLVELPKGLTTPRTEQARGQHHQGPLHIPTP